MAKRRGFFKKAYSRARTITRYVKNKGRRANRSIGSSSVKPIQMDAMAYGAVRNFGVGLAAPLTNMVDNYIPTDIAEPLVMGTATYLLAKNTSGMIRQMALKGLTCENYEMGKTLGARFLPSATSTSSNNAQGIVLG